MFRNGPKTDEGDIARLGPTTITWMTILKVLFVLDHDSGRYSGLAGPISYPPIPGVVHTSDGRRNMRRFVYFRTDAHTWLGVTRYFICIYMSFPLLPFFFFIYLFFFLRLGLCSALMAYWQRGTRCGHVFDFDWLGSLVSGGNLFSFPHFPRQRAF